MYFYTIVTYTERRKNKHNYKNKQNSCDVTCHFQRYRWPSYIAIFLRIVILLTLALSTFIHYRTVFLQCNIVRCSTAWYTI